MRFAYATGLLAVSAIGLTSIAASAGVWLAYPTERRRSPKIAAFRDWLMAGVESDPVIARYRDFANIPVVEPR